MNWKRDCCTMGGICKEWECLQRRGEGQAQPLICMHAA